MNTDFDPHNKIAEFGMLCVVKEYEGQGLGTELISQAEGRTRSKGC